MSFPAGYETASPSRAGAAWTAIAGTISGRESETIMCGRVRLSSDYSEIKIRLKFAPNSVAPNFEPDWNKPPTAPMLVAIRSVNSERAGFPFKVHVHMLRHACGYALANAGHDTRAIRDWLGHRAIQHTARYRS